MCCVFTRCHHAVPTYTFFYKHDVGAVWRHGVGVCAYLVCYEINLNQVVCPEPRSEALDVSVQVVARHDHGTAASAAHRGQIDEAGGAGASQRPRNIRVQADLVNACTHMCDRHILLTQVRTHRNATRRRFVICTGPYAVKTSAMSTLSCLQRWRDGTVQEPKRIPRPACCAHSTGCKTAQRTIWLLDARAGQAGEPARVRADTTDVQLGTHRCTRTDPRYADTSDTRVRVM